MSTSTSTSLKPLDVSALLAPIDAASTREALVLLARAAEAADRSDGMMDSPALCFAPSPVPLPPLKPRSCRYDESLPLARAMA